MSRGNRRGFKNFEEGTSFKVIRLHEGELHEVLDDLGVNPRKIQGRKGTNFQFLCPFHGERRRSAGILIDDSGDMYGQCFTCGEHFSLPKLYAHVHDISIMSAIDELEEKYRSEIRTEIMNADKLKSYDDILGEKRSSKGKRKELSKLDLAPYKSGKETHEYFFNRGFDMDDVVSNLIGWDRVRKRITIPIFYDDGVLAGFSGRAVLEERKNGKVNKTYVKHYGEEPKYFLYDRLIIGDLLYGSHEFPEGEETVILVEGLFDRMWLKKLGFKNVMSTIIAKITIRDDGYSEQVNILKRKGIKNLVLMLDNDDAGKKGMKYIYDKLKKEFNIFIVEYPKEYKDVLGDDYNAPLSYKQVKKMIDNKKPYLKGTTKLKRL